MASRSAGWRIGTALLASAAVVLAVLALRRAARPPRGPEEPAWDRQACAQCGMLVGEPAFAAQIQTRDGRVLHFDDPGCLVTYEAEHHPDALATYFHHLRENRWLAKARTAFLPVERSPMGYGIGVVDVGTPGAISYEAARARILERRGREGPR